MSERKLVRVAATLSSLFVLVIMATSCATTSKYETSLNSWIGVHVDNLLPSWGSPQKSYPLPDGGHIVEYVQEESVPIVGYTNVPYTTYQSGSAVSGSYGSYTHGIYSGTTTAYIPEQTPIYNIRRWCKTRFFIGPDGIVKSWQWQGNHCKARYRK